MVFSFSPFFVLLVSAEAALSFSQSDLLPICTCSSSQLELHVGTVGQSNPCFLWVLGTKSNVQYIEVAPESNAVLQNEKINYSKDKYIGGLGWIRAIWTVIDLLLGQFVLTPVSGHITHTWSRTIPTGHLSSDSSICKSWREFSARLVRFNTIYVEVSAGSTSVRCSEAARATQITGYFSSNSKGTFSCNGNSWSVGNCGHGREITVAVVGQSKICMCGASGHTGTIAIRPCINNAHWGGIGKQMCYSVKTRLSITVRGHNLPPINMPTRTPTDQPTSSPTVMPSETPSIQPTTMPTETPTAQPTSSPTVMPSETPSAPPTSSPTAKPTVHVDLISDFDIIDKNKDGSLNYDEIAFAIADTNKDDKLSLKEYEAARADRIFIDTTYSPTNTSIVKFSDDVNFTTDFDIIDRNGDQFLNYEEVAFAIADIKKDGKLSLEEYEAARADRIFVDTSYKLK